MDLIFCKLKKARAYYFGSGKNRLGEVAKEACILIRCRDDLPP